MCLEGYLGMFRKSQEVWARNFDPKGVNASRKPNPGTLCPPPPRVIGLSKQTEKQLLLESEFFLFLQSIKSMKYLCIQECLD